MIERFGGAGRDFDMRRRDALAHIRGDLHDGGFNDGCFGSTAHVLPNRSGLMFALFPRLLETLSRVFMRTG